MIKYMRSCPHLFVALGKEEKDSDKKGEGRSHGDLVMKGTNPWPLIRTHITGSGWPARDDSDNGK